jgi:hypothetical protein
MSSASTLSETIAVDRVLSYFAAGTTKRTSTILDMAGFDGVVFIADFSTLIDTGVIDAYAEQHTLNQTSGMTRVLGQTTHTVTTAQAAMTASCIVVEIHRPQERYIQFNVTPSVQNAVITGVTAIRYKGRKLPVTQSTNTLKSTVLASPGE